MLNNVNFKRILLTFKRHIQAQKNQIKPLIMKKISLFLITAAYFAVSLQAQRSMPQALELLHPSQMLMLENRHFIKELPIPTTHLPLERSGPVSFVALGAAPNIYTTLIDEQNQIDYNPLLDAVVFVHRLDVLGNTGVVGYDRSLDGGASFTNNISITPDYEAGSAPVGGGRYPNITLWNPAGNTNPANAYIIESGPNLQPGGTDWGWLRATSARLSDGSNIAEDYYQQVPGANSEFFPMGLNVNADGSVWSVHTRFTGAPDDYGVFYINKGVFNTTTNQVDWTLAHETLDVDMSVGSSGENSGADAWNIAFGPDGQTGYVVISMHSNSSPYIGSQPIVYKSIDAGDTWTKLPEYNFSGSPFSDFSVSFVGTELGGGALGFNPHFSTIDITVDADDDLHVFSNVRSHTNTGLDSLGFFWDAADGILAHLTTSNGSDWSFNLVDSIVTGPAGTEAGLGAGFYIFNATNISRSADGEKIFFTWNATDPNVLSYNGLPNLRIKGYDITSQEYTFTREPTAGSAVDGTIQYPRSAPTVMETGEDFDYEIPVEFAQLGISDINPANFFFIRGAGFNEDEFGVSAPNATADFSFVVSTTGSGTVIFTNLSIDASEYVWDFGDSSPLSGLTNPSKTFGASGVYNVCLTAKNSGSPATDDTQCKAVDVLVNGLEDALLAEALTVFPSPTSGQLNVTINGQVSGEFTIQVYNLLGEEVVAAQRTIAGSNASIQLDLSSLANGQYLVKVQNEGAVTMRSVSVSK